MSEQQIYERIRLAMNEAPRNRQTAELHLQMIKYADDETNNYFKSVKELNNAESTDQTFEKKKKSKKNS